MLVTKLSAQGMKYTVFTIVWNFKKRDVQGALLCLYCTFRLVAWGGLWNCVCSYPAGLSPFSLHVGIFSTGKQNSCCVSYLTTSHILRACRFTCGAMEEYDGAFVGPSSHMHANCLAQRKQEKWEAEGNTCAKHLRPCIQCLLCTTLCRSHVSCNVRFLRQYENFCLLGCEAV
jgi:hypothetical protein